MGTVFVDPDYEMYRHLLTKGLLMKECRLKTLRDLCLECVGKNLHCITRASQYLAPLHKELIIERLAFHDLFTPEYLPHVTYNLFSPRLKRINFYKCHQIDETLLKLLAKSECKLQHLTIHDCKQVNDAAVLHITKDQNELQTLELRKLKITKRGVQNIKSPILEKLDFRACSTLDSAALHSVVSANPSIKHLNIVGCQKLTEDAFVSVGKCLQNNLEVLDAAEVHCLTDDSLVALADHCPNLRSLIILGCNKITEGSVTHLFNKCKSLDCLDLSYCSKIVQNTVSARQVMLNLPVLMQNLSLNGVLLEDGDLLAEGLSFLSKLKRLKLSGVPALNDASLEQIMQKIGQQLEYFDISGSVFSTISDHGLRSVAKYCHKLEVLSLSLLKNITGVTLLPLLEDKKRAPLLTKLLLSIRQMDPSVLEAITENCYNLQQLCLSGLSIVTDTTLKSLASNCKELTDIRIKACRHVTDEGVIALAVNCPLCIVVLSGLHNLTDKSILTLANTCPYLEELYISGCDRVSPGAVTYLKDSCICRVYIMHRVANAKNTAHNLDTGDYVNM